MGREDWYRLTTWTKKDQEGFFKKLNRASHFGRKQYLRIQASYLIDTKLKKHLAAAEKLLNKLISNYTDLNTELSLIYLEYGRIYYFSKEYEKALKYFKKSMDYEIIFPYSLTNSYIYYSLTIVRLMEVKKFNKVFKLLMEKINTDSITFPRENYITYSVLSIITKYKGDFENAKFFRDLAENNAKAEVNSLWNPRKKKYGLVKNRIVWLDKLVKKRQLN